MTTGGGLGLARAGEATAVATRPTATRARTSLAALYNVMREKLSGDPLVPTLS
jgi:hypothetical protein